jgi:hypothetical protein
MTKEKTSKELRSERDQAQADLSAAEARGAALETEGTVSEQTISELASCNAKAQLLRGAIRRMEQAIPQIERIEAAGEIERLRGVIRDEDQVADREARRLHKAAIKLLVPKDDSHPAWSAAYCRRREHEIFAFAQEHPAARRHTDLARDARSEIKRLEAIIRGS